MLNAVSEDYYAHIGYTGYTIVPINLCFSFELRARLAFSCQPGWIFHLA